jgi:hypothetical protein
MALRDAVVALIRNWTNLPYLVGDRWPEVAPALRAVIARMAQATTDAERVELASDLLVLLQPYSRARDILQPEVTRSTSRLYRESAQPANKTRDEASWPALSQTLASIALAGTSPPATVDTRDNPKVMFKVDVAHVEITRDLGVPSAEEPPLLHEESPAMAPTPDQDKPSEATPTPQWINASFEDVGPAQPLLVDQPYTLAFDAGDAPDPNAVSTERADLEFAPGQDSLELTVRLVSKDLEIDPAEQPLVVRRTVGSGLPARFRVTARSPGVANATAIFLKDNNFIQIMTLKISVASGEEALLADAHGRPLTGAAKVASRDASIVLVQSGGQHQLWLNAGTSVMATLPMTRDELDDMIMEARAELRNLVHLEVNHELVYQTRIDIPVEIHQAALKRLARAGYRLYQRMFFGPSADAQLQRVGTLLCELSRRPSLRMQVVSQGLLVPWHLMYLADNFDDRNIDAERLLGARHVIEYIPLDSSASGGVIDPEMDTTDGLQVALSMNTDVDDAGGSTVTAQLDYWRAQQDRGVRMRLDRTAADVVAALADPRSPDQVLYYYCHAVAAQPGQPGSPDDSSLVLSGDDRIVLRDLYIDAPANRRLPGVPLVVLNACGSAEMSPRFYEGFLPYFIAKGARGVIGTEAETPALFAAEWARRFFDSVLSGQPVGEAVLSVRRDFLENHANIMAFLYALYCDGDTVLQPALRAAADN